MAHLFRPFYMTLPVLASAATIAALAACTASEPRAVPAPAALAESVSTANFLPTEAPGVWNPVRPGITVTFADTREPAAMTVSYRREPANPAGIALMLTPNACPHLDAFAIRAAATPSQRLNVCLTDADGVVWAFPTIKLGASVETHLVRLSDLRPDPFQNGGKTIPAAPALSGMKMLTILDVSGFMGAAVEDCTWTIESVLGEEVAR